MTHVMGVDPGLSGSLFTSDGHCHDMPTIDVRGKRRIDTRALVDLIVDIGPVDLVIVEEVQGVQGTGATSAFTFGKGAGIIEGVLTALDRPWQYVTPQRWTKDLGVGNDKGAHRQAAMRLYPDVAHLFSRVKDDGRADAALLAWWGRRA